MTYSCRRFGSSVWLCSQGCCWGCGPARAQEPDSRAAEVAAEQERKAQALTPYHPGWFERKLLESTRPAALAPPAEFVVAFGDIKRGTGPDWARPTDTFQERRRCSTQTVYRSATPKSRQVSLQTPHFFKRRLTIGTASAGRTCPNVVFHGLAPGVAPVRAWYLVGNPVRGQRRRGVQAGTRAAVRSGDGPCNASTPASRPRRRTCRASASSPECPGVGPIPDYLHSFASAAIDSRDAARLPRHGSLLRATIHDFRQQNTGPYSFRRLDGVAEAVSADPVAGNWVFYFGVRASTTQTDAGQSVPYFLMPDLGGHYLRGYGTYRFVDKHSITVTAEYPVVRAGVTSTPPFSTMPARLCPSGRRSTSLASTSRTAPAFACTDRARRCSGSKWREATRARVSFFAFSPVGGYSAMRRAVHASDRCHAGTRDRACRGRVPSGLLEAQRARTGTKFFDDDPLMRIADTQDAAKVQPREISLDLRREHQSLGRPGLKDVGRAESVNTIDEVPDSPGSPIAPRSYADEIAARRRPTTPGPRPASGRSAASRTVSRQASRSSISGGAATSSSSTRRVCRSSAPAPKPWSPACSTRSGTTCPVEHRHASPREPGHWSGRDRQAPERRQTPDASLRHRRAALTRRTQPGRLVSGQLRQRPRRQAARRVQVRGHTLRRSQRRRPAREPARAARAAGVQRLAESH